MKRFTMGLIVLFMVAISVLAKSPSDQPIFVKEYIGQIDFVKGRFLQLEEAMSEEQVQLDAR